MASKFALAFPFAARVGAFVPPRNPCHFSPISPRLWAAKTPRSGLLQEVLECTGTAIQCRGSPRGYAALDRLGELSDRRTPFDFTSHVSSGVGTYLEPASLIMAHRELLPAETTAKCLRRVAEMEREGSYNTEPDSVDGVPSLHLNLVVRGKLVVDPACQDVFSLVEPFIFESLLPHVQEKMGNVVVNEVFLRRYGGDVGRCSISAHFDVLSVATAVIALDDAAADGRNGLYMSASDSNHAALRQFFPLNQGDAVVHTWDVLHGVDVEPAVQRTSLIVWFTPALDNADESVTNDVKELQDKPKWIANREDLSTHSVAQFLLGSSLEGSYSGAVGQENPYDMYMKSASLGNAFSLDRLGTLCCEGKLTAFQVGKTISVLKDLRSSQDWPEPLVQELNDNSDGGETASCAAAKLLWYEAASRGLATSQIWLGYACMKDAARHNSADLRLLAAVLFCLAEQQGGEISSAARFASKQTVEMYIRNQLEEFPGKRFLGEGEPGI